MQDGRHNDLFGAALAQLEEFSTLKRGWNGGRAAPIDEQALTRARALVEALDPRLPCPSVSPTPSGAVLLRWVSRDEALEVEVTLRGDGGEYVVGKLGDPHAIEEGSLKPDFTALPDILLRHLSVKT